MYSLAQCVTCNTHSAVQCTAVQGTKHRTALYRSVFDTQHSTVQRLQNQCSLVGRSYRCCIVGPACVWYAGLDSSQLQAVSLALSSQDIALVHGPPGTGKQLPSLHTRLLWPESKSNANMLCCLYVCKTYCRLGQVLARCSCLLPG